METARSSAGKSASAPHFYFFFESNRKILYIIIQDIVNYFNTL